MALTQERKHELIEEHKKHASDTGSPEVQIAILTENIVNLTDHLRDAQERSSFASWSCSKWLVSVVNCWHT